MPVIEARILPATGTPLEQAQLLRDLLVKVEAGEIKFLTIATLYKDGGTGHAHSGNASFVEHIGLIELHRDTVYKRSEEEW